MRQHFFCPALTKIALIQICLLLAACGPSRQADPGTDSASSSTTITTSPAPDETTATQTVETVLRATPTPKPRMSVKITPERMFKYMGQPGIVHITWTTRSEKDSFGFNVMRGTRPEGPFKPANKNPLLGAAGNSSILREYEFFDTSVKVGESYYYFMQQINLKGETTDRKDWMKDIVVNRLNLDKVKGDPVLEDAKMTSAALAAAAAADTDGTTAPTAAPSPAKR